MRNLTILFVVFAFVLSVQVFAQPILKVEPGYGTLNAAIAANGGTKIYELKAGAWYGLNAEIEVKDMELKIFGEAPAAGAMPAILQTGNLADGNIFPRMFNALSHLTIKNVFVVNQDLAGQIANQIVQVSGDKVRIIMDNVTIDPVGTSSLIGLSGQDAKIYLTNSLFLRMGHMANPNDGHFIAYGGNPLDTLYLENNTIVSTGTGFQAGDFPKVKDNFVWINHNTIIHHKSQLNWSFFEKDYYFTNNILFDFNTQPWNANWTQYFPDGGAGQKISCLICDDTLMVDNGNGTFSPEPLPSIRKRFIEYNLQFTSQGFKDVIQWGKDNGKEPAYLMPLLWGPEDAAKSRETRMYMDDVSFPFWKFGNYMVDIDPKWTDNRIYIKSADFATWTLPMTIQHCWGGAAADPAALPKWHWNADEGVDPQNYPVAWPRFNGTYSNPQLLSASIEKMPLGDLNWYPEKKAVWEDNKFAYMMHIMSLNEKQIGETGISDITMLPVEFSLYQNYPNPFNPTTKIEYQLSKNAAIKIMVFNSRGQLIKTLVDEKQETGKHFCLWDGTNDAGVKVASGIYFYKLQSENFLQIRKLVLMK